MSATSLPWSVTRPARPPLLLLLAVAVALVASLVLLPAAPGRASAGGTQLLAGEQLRSGQRLVAGDYQLVMQGDGNLVAYAPGGRVRWHTGTAGHAGARLVMQSDGNPVLYSASGRALWHAGTQGNARARLVLQRDGNVVVYRSDNRALWHIGADGKARLVDPSGLYAIRSGVPSGNCGSPDQLALQMADARSIWHGGTGWNGQIVAYGGGAPELVRAWQQSPPHVAVAGDRSWTRMEAGAALGTDGRMYGVVNFCR